MRSGRAPERTRPRTTSGAARTESNMTSLYRRMAFAGVAAALAGSCVERAQVRERTSDGHFVAPPAADGGTDTDAGTKTDGGTETDGGTDLRPLASPTVVAYYPGWSSSTTPLAPASVPWSKL